MIQHNRRGADRTNERLWSIIFALSFILTLKIFPQILEILL